MHQWKSSSKIGAHLYINGGNCGGAVGGQFGGPTQPSTIENEVSQK